MNQSSSQNEPGAPVELGFHLQSDADLTRLGLPQWVLVERAIGHDPWNRSGANFAVYQDLGMRVICRLTHGAYPRGSLPFSQNYGAFARRCANFVAASAGCHVWIIGHEPNYRQRWPAILAEVREDTASAGNIPSINSRDKYAVPTTPPAPQAADESGTRQRDSAVAPHAGEPASWWRRLVARLSGAGDARVNISHADTSGTSPGERRADVYLAKDTARVPTSSYAGGRFNALRASGSNDTSSHDDQDVAASGYAEVITPRKYVACFRLCRRAIRAVPGHENDLVLLAGPAPWTTHAAYAANPEGDWITYFRHMTGLLSPQECDGMALHVYTQSSMPAKSAQETDDTLDEGVSVLADFLHALPESMADAPVFVTECGPVAGWSAAAEGWLDRFVAHLNRAFDGRPLPQAFVLAHEEAEPWALTSEQARRIGLSDRLSVWDDAQFANTGLPRLGVQLHPHSSPMMTPLRRRDVVLTTTVVNMRRQPGYLDKAADDVVAEVAAGVRLEILSDGSTAQDGLQWQRARIAQGQDENHEGWVAETGIDGRPLLVKATGNEPGSIRTGGQIRVLLPARVRRSAGYLGKPDNDVLGEAGTGSVWRVASGPAVADDLTWWDIEGQNETGPLRGWSAETAPGGLRLFSPLDGGEPDTSRPPAPVQGQFRPGDLVVTLAHVRLRRAPGYVDKGPEDVVADIWQGTDVLVLAGPQGLDGLIWYEVEARVADGPYLRGWMAERAPGDIPLLGVREARFEEDFALGELVVVGASPLRVRRSPGVQGKPEDDVLGEFYPRATLNILSRQQTADDMRWWRVGGIATHGPVRGWVAQSTSQGVALVRRPARLPGTNIPDRAAGACLHRPFAGRFGISQLWGERASFYARFTYDGEPLRGHNGIDFLTPMHTPILATEGGVVAMTGFEPGGFGHFVLLDHAWGQSIYAHLDSIAVTGGQTVGRGQTMGQSGTSGNSSGPHLHFAIRIHPYRRDDGWGGYADPLPYLSPADVILPAYVQDEAVQSVWPQALLDLINVEPLPPPGMAEETPGMVRP